PPAVSGPALTPSPPSVPPATVPAAPPAAGTRAGLPAPGDIQPVSRSTVVTEPAARPPAFLPVQDAGTQPSMKAGAGRPAARPPPAAGCLQAQARDPTPAPNPSGPANPASAHPAHPTGPPLPHGGKGPPAEETWVRQGSGAEDFEPEDFGGLPAELVT